MNFKVKNRALSAVKAALLLGGMAGCYLLYYAFSSYVGDTAALITASEKVKAFSYILDTSPAGDREAPGEPLLAAGRELKRALDAEMALPANRDLFRESSAAFMELRPSLERLAADRRWATSPQARRLRHGLFGILRRLDSALQRTVLERNRLMLFTGMIYFPLFILLLLLEISQYLLVTDGLLAGLAGLRRKLTRRAAPFPGEPEPADELAELQAGADSLRAELRSLSEERLRLRKEADIRQWRMKIQSRSLEVTRKKIVALVDDLDIAKAGLQQERKALEEAKVKLERSNKELEQFAYVASHDLKEPLRIVSSFSGLLAKRYSGKLGQDADDFISYITQGAQRASDLITSLFNYSKVTYTTKAFRPLPAEDLLQKAIFNMKMAIEEKNARVTWSPLPFLYGDEFQLIQLFQNLISNSLKFNNSPTPVISVTAAEEEGFSALSFSDNGIGVAPEHFERIFLIFQRLHPQGKYPGTGIGLAVCKKIAENHGGSITVSSPPGEGCTFTLRFPVREDLARLQAEALGESNKERAATP